MRNNTRKRPEEPATPEPRDKSPRPVDTGTLAKNEETKTAPETAKHPPKKRKIDNSPPWKSATTQTPTSFMVDGRRKSGRTNPIPIELMPSTASTTNGAPTRQTRSSIAKPDEGKGGKLAALKSASRASAPHSPTTQNKSRASQKLPTRNVTSSSGSKNSKSPHKRARTPPPPSPPKLAAPKGTSKNSTPKTAEWRAKSTPSRMPVIYPGSRRTSARTATRIATEASVERANNGLGKIYKSEEIPFDSDGELDVSPDWIPPKIKIRFRRTPPLTIVHPLHIPPKPKYESFEAFLDSDEVLPDKRKPEEAEEEAQREAEIRQQVEDACKDGVLAPERCSLLMPEEQPGPPRQYFHHDQLIAHALNFQKLMERERRYHMGLAKKLATACAQKVQESIPKTKEEIEEEMRVETCKLYREAVVVGIRNKWALITEEVHRRRRERAEELRQQRGKEQLSQMLEHSTQLLKVRARRASILTASEAGEEDEEGEVEDGEESDLGEERVSEDEGSGDEEVEEQEEDMVDDDEANMTSSGSEDEDIDNDDDASLTVEQLREKYGRLANISNTENHSTRASSPMSIDDPDDTSTPLSPPPVELEEVDDILLDTDDESVEMDSELASGSSEHDVEEEDGEDEEEGDEDASPCLIGFLGDLETFVKHSSAPAEDIEMLRDSHQANGIEDVEMEHDDRQENGVNDVRMDHHDHPENNTEKTNVNGAEPATVHNEVHESTDSTAMVKYKKITGANTEGVQALSSGTLSQNGQLDPDDDTSFSNSPAQNKNSGSTTSHTTPQPTLDIKTPIPFLLRGTLREYQHYGLDWLAGLYSNKTNGILADEMGLGKTIQTIALIAHLACEKEIWGPHLIVVPTSVMLNWEMEFKKWAPGFKILTYYGSREERAIKRKGWFDDNLWHVCITSYQLVLQDQVTFKRRNWHYLILDEAHNIKNFRSQRWQTLLNFKAEARLLITGTPLQNNLIELWSLLYFLMPSGVSESMPTGFANLKEFQEWFAHPVDQMIEGGREQMDDEARNTVTKLHRVLRPYLLRRLKADVEKQMPAKYEHVVYCRLSKRQRYLYDDFMSLAKTRETLASGNYLSIINCLMQLRKVCNHPDLFETRQIVTSYSMNRSVAAEFEIKELLVRRKLMNDSDSSLDFGLLNLTPTAIDASMSKHTASSLRRLNDTKSLRYLYTTESSQIMENMRPDFTNIEKNRVFRENLKKSSLLDQLKHCIYLNELRCNAEPMYGSNVLEVCKIDIGPIKTRPLRRAEITQNFLSESSLIRSMISTLAEREEQMATLVDKYGCVTPHVVCTDLPPLALSPIGIEVVTRARQELPWDPFHKARVRLSIAFPDKRLLQYDCGKLQRLDILLRELQAGGHRALIFTQMTKVLDILEQFLNIHGHRYLRLDGSTKVEQRQVLTDRFNNDPRILVFILSTRSGGLGINLTGADTVIFYDLDWNPAMDKQCQDRCHRIGQTRDVHIYRFVSEYTIESNILRKANQKRMLDDVVIQEGDFTTDYFNKLTLKDMLGEDIVKELAPEAADEELVIRASRGQVGGVERALELAEDVEDAAAAKAAQRELVDVDGADFGETIKPTLNTVRSNSGTKENGTPIAGTATTTTTTTTAPTPKDIVMVDVTAPADDEPQEDDSEPGHIDEWMIHYMEWEIDTLPVLPASKDSKKRRREKSKKGKLYR